MGISGSEAAAGACPATAWRAPTRAVASNRAVNIKLRCISRLLYRVYCTTVFGIARCRGRDLNGRWYRGRQQLAERQSHCRYLLQLGDNDFLGHASERLIASVAQFGLRHLDCTLVMRHHHCNEISIDIARGP